LSGVQVSARFHAVNREKRYARNPEVVSQQLKNVEAKHYIDEDNASKGSLGIT
jgi:hypothetical protein